MTPRCDRPDWADDDVLLGDLAAAVRGHRELADRVARNATELFTWTVDDDLLVASLAYDSALEPAATVRSGPTASRLLVFEAEPLSVELEVTPQQILGQLVPPQPGEIVVESDGAEQARVAADDTGFFVVAPLPRGRLRLRCDTATGRVVTDWVTMTG